MYAASSRFLTWWECTRERREVAELEALAATLLTLFGASSRLPRAR